MAMKLFMFYVGGRYRNANVELHDVRFSLGPSFESCFEDLRRQWWGDPDSLHLDCWGAVEQADGFDIEISAEPASERADRLFFANMGGYDPREFAELHRNVLIVADSAASAKARALAAIKGWALPHKDNLFEVENLLDLNALASGYGRGLRLTRAIVARPFAFACDYLPIA